MTRPFRIVALLSALVLSLAAAPARAAAGPRTVVPPQAQMATPYGQQGVYDMLFRFERFISPDDQATYRTQGVLNRGQFAKIINWVVENLDLLNQPGQEALKEAYGWSNDDEAILGILIEEFKAELRSINSAHPRYRDKQMAQAQAAAAPKPRRARKKTATPTPTPAPTAEPRLFWEGSVAAERYQNENRGQTYVDPTTYAPVNKSSVNVENDGYTAERLGGKIRWRYDEDTDMTLRGNVENRDYDQIGRVVFGRLDEFSIEKKDSYLLYGGYLPAGYLLKNGKRKTPLSWSPYSLDLQDKLGVYLWYDTMIGELEALAIQIRETKLPPPRAIVDVFGNTLSGNFASYGAGVKHTLNWMDGVQSQVYYLRSWEDRESLTAAQRASSVVNMGVATSTLGRIKSTVFDAADAYETWAGSYGAANPTLPSSLQGDYYGAAIPPPGPYPVMPLAFPALPPSPWPSYSDFLTEYLGLIADIATVETLIQGSRTSSELSQLSDNIDDIKDRARAFADNIRLFLGGPVYTWLQPTTGFFPVFLANEKTMVTGGSQEDLVLDALIARSGLLATVFNTRAGTLLVRVNQLDDLSSAKVAVSSIIKATQTDILGGRMIVAADLFRLDGEYVTSNHIADLEAPGIPALQDAAATVRGGTLFGPIVVNANAYSVGPNFHNDLLVRPQSVPGNLNLNRPKPNFPYPAGTRGYGTSASLDFYDIFAGIRTTLNEGKKPEAGDVKPMLQLGGTLNFRETIPLTYQKQEALGDVAAQLKAGANTFALNYSAGISQYQSVSGAATVTSQTTFLTQKGSLSDSFEPNKHFSLNAAADAEQLIDQSTSIDAKVIFKGTLGMRLQNGGFGARYNGRVDVEERSVAIYDAEKALGDYIDGYNPYYNTVIGLGSTQSLAHDARIGVAFKPAPGLAMTWEPFVGGNYRQNRVNSILLADAVQVIEGLKHDYQVTDSLTNDATITASQFRFRQPDRDYNGNPIYTEEGSPVGTPDRNEFQVQAGFKYGMDWFEFMDGLYFKVGDRYTSSQLLIGGVSPLEYNTFYYGAGYNHRWAGDVDSNVYWTHELYTLAGGTDFMNVDARETDSLTANVAIPISKGGSIGVRARSSSVVSKFVNRTFNEVLLKASWNFGGSK